MKRILSALSLLLIGGIAYAGNGAYNGVPISSGTNFRNVSTYANDDGGSRQAIVLGNRSSSDTARVDDLGSLQVYVQNPTTATVTQSGTWTVQPGNTANTTAWKVDGSAVTQPVSGTFWQATQPISGTVTAAQTTNASLHASCDIDGSSNTIKLNDGSGNSVGSTSNALDINIKSGSIANTSFAATQTTNSSLHASVDIDGSSNTVKAAGDVAGGSSDSGNPVKIGGIGHTTYQTAVTDTQRVDAAFDSEGKQLMMPYSVPALFTSGTTSAITNTTQNVLISSPGANINAYVTGISCFNSHATVGTVINIRNAQTLKYTGYAVAAGGGFSVTFPTPLAGAGNSQWSAENATTGSNTYCNATGFLAKN